MRIQGAGWELLLRSAFSISACSNWIGAPPPLASP
jgi:hypothetical protein